MQSIYDLTYEQMKEFCPGLRLGSRFEATRFFSGCTAIGSILLMK